MSNNLEVVSFSDQEAVLQLARLSYANQEPGFQVDDVTNVESLREFFRLMRDAAPAVAADYVRFNDAYCIATDQSEYFDEASVPHLDEGSIGLRDSGCGRSHASDGH